MELLGCAFPCSPGVTKRARGGGRRRNPKQKKTHRSDREEPRRPSGRRECNLPGGCRRRRFVREGKRKQSSGQRAPCRRHAACVSLPHRAAWLEVKVKGTMQVKKPRESNRNAGNMMEEGDPRKKSSCFSNIKIFLISECALMLAQGTVGAYLVSGARGPAIAFITAWSRFACGAPASPCTQRRGDSTQILPRGAFHAAQMTLV